MAEHECGKGLQKKLQPWAYLCIAVYGVGIPLAFLHVALKEENLPHIKADQEHNRLRLKQKRGQSEEYEFHSRWHKVYYRYEPEYRWWGGVIFARKFAICVVTILFNANPVFQASMGLVVLFVSFAAQTQCKPSRCSTTPDAAVSLSGPTRTTRTARRSSTSTTSRRRTSGTRSARRTSRG